MARDKENYNEYMRNYFKKGTEAYEKQLVRNEEYRKRNLAKNAARMKAYRLKKKLEAQNG